MKFLMNFLFTALFLLSANTAHADAAIFSGSDVKLLKSNLDFNGGIKVLSASTDPTSSATSATRGSILCNTGGGNCYVKQDAGSSTNWNRLIFGNSSGVVAIAQGGTGQITANAGFNALSPMTTGGDLIYGGASGVGTRLANGSAGQVLTSAGGTSAPTWSSTPTFTTPIISTSINLTGGQIAFPASMVASAGANTLDDYEEGSFTPRIDGTSAAGLGTYSTQTGSYTKIGRAIYFRGVLAWSAHTGTGNMRLAGLPFTAGATTFVLHFSFNDALATAASNYPVGLIAASQTYADLYSQPLGSGSPAQIAMDTAVAAIYFSGFYFE